MADMEDSHPRAISIHNFSDKICDKPVHFHVMSLQDCFLLWFGFSPSLSNLAVGMCSRFDSAPLSTLILGDKSDPTASSFAQRLAKKTKKQVFVSISIPTNDSQLLMLIEKRIKQEMDTVPEKF
ncbi:PREDICTED: proteasome assembly chaperone 4 [Nanorana parkeri]|uniref:proteasome assembly chaperone 4 n=1 Tax=Nanorana parkeri TaxID=125878 RepID=UPI000854B2A4|nr:PREDICTED: proteasome assembly chaperone 4 [Nanorana parkeri]